MGFRFRRSARLGPLRFNFAKGCLSSISVGGRGGSFNVPATRRGGPRTTVGLLGTGLSWSAEHTPETAQPPPLGPAMGLPICRRLRADQLGALRQDLLDLLQRQLFSPGSAGQQLWELGLVSRQLADGSIGARTTGLLAVIQTPEALEGYLLRAQGQYPGRDDDGAGAEHQSRRRWLRPGVRSQPWPPCCSRPGRGHLRAARCANGRATRPQLRWQSLGLHCRDRGS